ncbi:MAG: ABC transporter ATP-binding protein [Candidatus Gracilibacteria bacterium]|nr:ABC transporter ATP-binding protein [Candidatus Gracilibacteria bacterium]
MVLKVKELNKSFKGKQILHDVSFDVGEGEMYGFLGPNGAGKTTTMKSILGFIKPDSGSIKVFGGKNFSIKDKKKIGFMPENTYLYKHLTGREFLKFNGGFFGFTKKELDDKTEKLLKKVGLDEAGDKYLKDYSKGMLQRVGLAQAIINDPKLLFLDEPMSGLDPIGRKMVKDLLLELKAKGTTVFFNTHILSDVESICDKVSIIHKGHIIVSGKKIKDLDCPLEEFFISKINEFNEASKA